MIKIYIVITFSLITLGGYSQIKEFVPLKGYKGSIELGFAAGAGETAHNRGEFLIVNGYQFNNRLSAGIGTGIQLWQLSNRVTIPIFADIEATFMKKIITPYTSIRVGYNINTQREDFLPKEGVYFSPTIGFRWGMSEYNALKLGVGYLLQSSDIIRNYGSPFNAFNEKVFFHSLVARVGFEF